jgi:hypothetical protein
MIQKKDKIMDIQEHHKTWHGFLNVTKIVTIAIIGIMVILGFVLI